MRERRVHRRLGCLTACLQAQAARLAEHLAARPQISLPDLAWTLSEHRSHLLRRAGLLVAEHGGRNVPVSPMALAFNLWFSPTGLLPASQVPRVYQQEVDWIFHARDVILSPAELLTRVQDYRRRGIAREDTVPAPVGLESRCDI